MSLDTYLYYTKKAQPTAADLISLPLLNELFATLSDALLLSATIFAPRTPMDPAVGPIVVPLYSDAYTLFSYITYCFQQLYDTSKSV